MLELNDRMDARQIAEQTRAALAETFASPSFQSRVLKARLDGAQRERLATAVMEAMAIIKRGPHRADEAIRVDAGEMGYLSRELLYKLRGVKEVKYAEMKGRQLVPVSNEVNAGAETYSYEYFDRTGAAKLGSSYEGRAPRADVKVGEVTGKVDVIRQAYGWTVQDLRAAAFAGRSLPTARGMACRAAMEFGIDENIANGCVNTSIKGLINSSTVPVYTSDGASSSNTLSGMTGDWANATAAEIVEDINLLIGAVRLATLEVHMLEKQVDIALPTAAYGAIATKAYSDLLPETVLAVVLKMNPFVRSITSWSRLTGAGVSSRDRALFYTRDPMNLEAQIPLEIMQHPPEPVALEFLVEMEARVAGTSIYYPLSAAYLDGV